MSDDRPTDVREWVTVSAPESRPSTASILRALEALAASKQALPVRVVTWLPAPDDDNPDERVVLYRPDRMPHFGSFQPPELLVRTEEMAALARRANLSLVEWDELAAQAFVARCLWMLGAGKGFESL